GGRAGGWGRRAGWDRRSPPPRAGSTPSSAPRSSCRKAGRRPESRSRVRRRARHVDIRAATPYGQMHLLSELAIRLERRFKYRLFSLLTAGATAESTDPSAIDLSSCRRLLLVRVNVRMGNLLLVTPALAALRNALPDARLDVLCYETYAPLLAHDPDIDRMLGFHRRMLCNPRALARLIRTLRRER